MSSLTITVAGVLFDMDGTLIDSNAMVEQVWTEFALEHSVDPYDVIEFAHGRPSRYTIARFLPAGESVDDWLGWISRAEAGRFGDVAAMPGAVEVTRALRTDSWAVVTSALREPALARIAAVGISEPRVLIGAEDVTHGKPDPEGYVRAAQLLGRDPSRCVVFEDTRAGVAAGLAAGCAVVAVGAADVGVDVPRILDWTNVTVTHGDELMITLG